MMDPAARSRQGGGKELGVRDRNTQEHCEQGELGNVASEAAGTRLCMCLKAPVGCLNGGWRALRAPSADE